MPEFSEPKSEGEAWWGEEDSNLRRLSQQIYSLPRLTASVPLRHADETSTPPQAAPSSSPKPKKERKQPCRHARHSRKPSWEA